MKKILLASSIVCLLSLGAFPHSVSFRYAGPTGQTSSTISGSGYCDLQKNFTIQAQFDRTPYHSNGWPFNFLYDMVWILEKDGSEITSWSESLDKRHDNVTNRVLTKKMRLTSGSYRVRVKLYVYDYWDGRQEDRVLETLSLPIEVTSFVTPSLEVVNVSGEHSGVGDTPGNPAVRDINGDNDIRLVNTFGMPCVDRYKLNILSKHGHGSAWISGNPEEIDLERKMNDLAQDLDNVTFPVVDPDGTLYRLWISDVDYVDYDNLPTSYVWFRFTDGKFEQTTQDYWPHAHDKIEATGDLDGDGVSEIVTLNGDELYYDKWDGQEWVRHAKGCGDIPCFGGMEHYDNLIVGDFDGDDDDDVLLLDNQRLYVAIYQMNYSTKEGWQLQKKWEAPQGHSILPYCQNGIAGDFNKDGRDEVVFIGRGWCTMFRWDRPDPYQNGQMKWWHSNYGDPYELQDYNQRYFAADLTGDGYEELFAVHKDGDQYGVFTFEDYPSSNRDWTLRLSGTGIHGTNFPDPTPNSWEQIDELVPMNMDCNSQVEVVSLQRMRTSGWVVVSRLRPDFSGWDWNWSNQGNSFLGSMYVPTIDGYSVETEYFPYEENGKMGLLRIDKKKEGYSSDLWAQVRTVVATNSCLPTRQELNHINHLEDAEFTARGPYTKVSYNIECFPNPFDVSVEVYSDEKEDLEIEVVDALSQVVHSETLSIGAISSLGSDLTPGIYIVRVSGSKGTEIRRVIKE